MITCLARTSFIAALKGEIPAIKRKRNNKFTVEVMLDGIGKQFDDAALSWSQLLEDRGNLRWYLSLEDGEDLCNCLAHMAIF